jgi:hypothetical protein
MRRPDVALREKSRMNNPLLQLHALAPFGDIGAEHVQPAIDAC